MLVDDGKWVVNDDKLIQVIWYILFKLKRPISKQHMINLLYLCERNSMVKYGYPVFTSEYWHIKNNGMVLFDVEDTINGLAYKSFIDLVKYDQNNDQLENLLGEDAFDDDFRESILDELSGKCIEDLDCVISEYGNFPLSQLWSNMQLRLSECWDAHRLNDNEIEDICYYTIFNQVSNGITGNVSERVKLYQEQVALFYMLLNNSKSLDNV